MFSSLKNKIKEETGSDINGPHQQRLNNNNRRSRFSSTMSINSTGEPNNEQAEQLSALRSQCNELNTKVTDLQAHIHTLQEEKTRTEKTNEILLESVRVAQTQKDIYCEEQEKIQNIQQHELEKLKSLLTFREQEAVDRLTAIRQSQQQIENLTGELDRLKPFEAMVEDLQDELDRLRHSSQLGKNTYTTTLAALEEENRNLKMRVQIMEQARLNVITTLGDEEKIQALVQERKLLAQHLEEAHLQLSDIKSSWSGQNLALETQVSRLSNQVAEETTEKRRALKARDECVERIKQLEFETIKLQDELRHRDNKIKLLEEEIDELNSSLKECREENEQQILFERNRSETLEKEANSLKTRLQSLDDRFNDYALNAEHVEQAVRQQNAQLNEQLNELQNRLDVEKEEKLTALLKNVEISQSEETLKKELRVERDEFNELSEKCDQMQQELLAKDKELQEGIAAVERLQTAVRDHESNIKRIDDMQGELAEKNKTIKMLNQRLTDLKKTVQQELGAISEISTNGHLGAKTPSVATCCYCGGNGTSGVVMDEVNFKYLKHVIIKFLTSREVEARHLIRAVATLLRLTKDEEKLLHDTLNWKMSWFGSKPERPLSKRPS